MENFNCCNVIAYKDILDLHNFHQGIDRFQCKQNKWQTQDYANITQIHQIGLGYFHSATIIYQLSD
jgi:hypothetical protein